MVDIIIHNGLVLTMDSQKNIIENGSVVIDKGKIVAIGKSEDLKLRYSAKKNIDATGKLIMPGLINTHTHSAMTIFRGIADDLYLQKWLTEYIFPVEAKFIDPANVRAGVELAMIEMIHSGTTTFNDMYFFQDEAAQTAKQVGMRCILNESVIDFPVPNSPTPDDGLKYTEYLLDKYKNDPLITIGVAAHAPYTCSSELLKKSRDFAKKYNIPYTIHLAETRWEVDTIIRKYGLTPTQYLDSLGILDDMVVAAHCVHLSEKDIKIIIDREVGVAHNPECNMKLASGVAPIPALLSKKAEIGLGTDGVASNNNLDMFEAMYVAALVHKLNSDDPTVANAMEIVEMATIGGAKVLEMDKFTGSLEINKQADIIIIDLNKPHLVPLFNIYSHIVYSMKGSDVIHTIIDGKLIMENNKILTINEENVKSKVREIASKIELHKK